VQDITTFNVIAACNEIRPKYSRSGCKYRFTSSLWTLTESLDVVLFLVRLCLNRQAMLLLSGLGVPDDSFFKLQDRMLENMANILTDEKTAVEAIAKVCVLS